MGIAANPWDDPYGNELMRNMEKQRQMYEMQRMQQNSLASALGIGNATKPQYAADPLRPQPKQDPQPNPVLLLTGDDE